MEIPFFPWEGRIIVIYNIPKKASPTDLRDFLLCRGKILRVDIEINSYGHRTGVAFVEFYSPENAQYALSFDSNYFSGVNLELQIASNPPQQLIKHYVIKPSQRLKPSDIIIENPLDQSKLINIYPRHVRRRTRKLDIDIPKHRTEEEEEEEEIADENDSYSFSEDIDSEYDN